MKQFGGPTTPAKSVEDLGAAYFASNGGSANSSRSDNEGKYWQGNNSLSDDKNTAGSVVKQTFTNIAVNPTPGFLNYWNTNNDALWIPTYAANEISYDRQSGADPGIVTSALQLSVVGIQTIPLGVNYQRSVEVWVDLPATIVKRFASGFIGGQAIPANTWTRVVQQFVGTGVAEWVMNFEVSIPGVGIGIHCKLRKAQLIANLSGQTQPYFDGSTTDTAQYHYAWVGAPNNSMSTATPK